MADVTQAFDSKRTRGDLVSVPVAASAVYSGTLGSFNAAGFLDNGGDDANTYFAGVIADTVDNSAGSAGDLEASVYTEGIFEFNKASAVQADIGEVAYLSDNNTVALVGDTTNDVPCGVIVALVSSSVVKVKIAVARI